jgi:hypothetical protein
MASAAILKAVKLLRNYCQITVRLPLDYIAIIRHSQELRSSKVRRWASPPSYIPFVAVGRDGACGHRGPTRGQNESVDPLSYENVEGQGITLGGCPHRNPQPPGFFPNAPARRARAGSWAVGFADLRSDNEKAGSYRTAHGAPGIIISAINKTRGACTVRADLPANQTPSALLMGPPGTAVAAQAMGPGGPPLCLHRGENRCYRALRAPRSRTNEEHRMTILGS